MNWSPTRPCDRCGLPLDPATHDCIAALLENRTAESARVTMTVLEVCKEVGRSRPFVTKLLNKKVIPNVKVGRSYIITRHAFAEWQRTCGVQREAVN